MGEKNYHDTWKNKIKILPRPKDSCWVDDGVNYNNDEEKIEGEEEDGGYSEHVPCSKERAKWCLYFYSFGLLLKQQGNPVK